MKKLNIYMFKNLQNHCLTIYLCMFPLVVNVWKHIEHLYGLSPLWTSMWRSRELAELKAFPQILQEWSVPPLSVLCWRINEAQMSLLWDIVYVYIIYKEISIKYLPFQWNYDLQILKQTNMLNQIAVVQ